MVSLELDNNGWWRWQQPTRFRRHGFGKVDALFAIAMTGLLGSLAVTALPNIRELARHRTCSDNIRRLGVAFHYYHDVHRRLPAAATWTATGIDVSRFLKVRDTVPLTHQNWVHSLLPLLNAEDLQSTFNLSRPICDSSNAKGRETELDVMRCPADTFNHPDNHYTYEATNGVNVSFARGNYAINGGSQSIYEWPGRLAVPIMDGHMAWFDKKTDQFQWWGNGVAGINKSFSYDEFVNALSTTVMVDEIRAGIHPIDPRGVWALGQIGGSITWAHGIGGDAGHPNSPLTEADDILRGPELNELLGRDHLFREGMTACDHMDKNQQAAARSQHEGGVNVLMADGALRFIGNRVDPGIWHLMHSRLTPQGVIPEPIASSSTAVEHIEAPAPSRRPLEPAKDSVDRTSEITNSIGMRFRLIPPGSFIMGLPDADNPGTPKEYPAHKVRLSGWFYIGVHEVTQQQFFKVVGKQPRWFAVGGQGEGALLERDTNHCPVENVTWDEATEFCRRLGERVEESTSGRSYRLPTEAEWEYCCRAGSTQPHQFTTAYDDSGETGAKAWRDPPIPITPVGTYRPNSFGLYDMRGNVWEWCSDWFVRDYYSWSASVDPQGPANGSHKVFRGTDWIFTGDHCKTRSIAGAPWERNHFIGFRVVCGLGTPPGDK